jgi:HEAT repeat protein
VRDGEDVRRHLHRLARRERDAMGVFLEFLHDPNARMRAAAIVGVGRCDGSNHLDNLAAALEDSSSLVRRAALQYARLYLGRGAVHRIRRSSST